MIIPFSNRFLENREYIMHRPSRRVHSSLASLSLPLLSLLLSLLLPLCTATVRVAVLGGNGMMGGDAVRELLSSGVADEVVVANRGSEYWGGESWDSTKVRHAVCDREQMQQCKELVDVPDEHFDFAVDFSGM